MNFLNNSFQKIINKIKNKKYIQEKDIESIMKEIRISFLEADVNYEVITRFNELIKKKSLGKEVLKGLNPQQQIIKIIRDTLTEILGFQNVGLNLNKKLDTILLIGLQGSGKTTISGKLSFFIKKKLNKKVLLIAADIYRFGAIEQLIAIGEKISVEVFFQKNNKVLDIIKNGLKYALINDFETVIIDSAGRLNIDKELIKELQKIKSISNPSEVLIVCDALLGQESSIVAKSFNEQIGATGVILTKMDADIKGGSALSIKSVTNLPIKFISSSEKHDDDFEIFYPERIASRILGMGDVLTLIDNIEEKIDKEKDQKILNRILQEDYNYFDLIKQINLIKKIGSMKKILNFIPGIGNQIKNLPFLENDIIKKMESIIKSMTNEEKRNPNLIESNNRRRTRISKGSGNNLKDVNYLISFIKKQKEISKKMGNFSNNNLLEDLANEQDIIKKFFDKN
ncbi:signal recognition particle protein [Texas Phoenix palm phytoplasma]|uniref:signal-recognition-particle GTPase n=1 Tax=Texas Phoenix palm phytoplasma TaxID=176709 RepID=A0ABS5BIU1_9MOLU|nr:signal recognition particle protein [Texas Phoenix palm phytoplasma]MBP3059514.1 signal recognition particle protein [Texas Phoenix palm phytoplasma]